MKQYNFNAGPSVLNQELIQDAIRSIGNQSKLSILELSHRSNEIINLFEETKQLIKDLMNLEARFEVLFLHGGASLQNCMIPYNISQRETASYINTGIWSKKSCEEARKIRKINILASSEAENYTYIPKNLNWDGKGYLHLTTNNTVSGTQFFKFSEFINKGALVADMSSDILSRNLNYNQFDLIYAGLQKNLGTAGGAIVIIDQNLVEDTPNLPTMLSYKAHIGAKSMLNTPPVFSIFMCNLVLKWIIKKGGVNKIEAANKAKSALLYKEIDCNNLLEGYVKIEDRSIMNATFKLKDEKLESAFNQFLDSKGIVGYKGHRSKGGYRISMYNMLAIEHVEYLVKVLQEFSA